MFTPEVKLHPSYQHPIAEVKSGDSITFNPILRSIGLGQWRGESVFDFKPFKVDGRLGQILLVRYNLADLFDQDLYTPAGEVDPYAYWVQLEKEKSPARVFLQYGSDRFQGVRSSVQMSEDLAEFREWMDPEVEELDENSNVIFPPTTDFSKVEIIVENP